VSTGTAIEWTQVTWNPVTGCDTISPGCDHCYARTLAKRLKAMGNPKYQRDGHPATSGPGFAVTWHPAALKLPYLWRAPRLVFVNSMSDLFHARVPEYFIRDVFDVMASTLQHTYQILTKRPQRALRMRDGALPWPPNVWLGVSVENDRYLWRAGLLRHIPAAVRFVSAEPLLGPLDRLDLAGIGWVIAGGESGPGYRRPEAAWFRGLRDQCVTAGVPFFFKQWGGATPKAGGRVLDGRTWDQMPAPARPIEEDACRA
jgi:protein gp37